MRYTGKMENEVSGVFLFMWRRHNKHKRGRNVQGHKKSQIVREGIENQCQGVLMSFILLVDVLGMRESEQTKILQYPYTCDRATFLR